MNGETSLHQPEGSKPLILDLYIWRKDDSEAMHPITVAANDGSFPDIPMFLQRSHVVLELVASKSR